MHQFCVEGNRIPIFFCECFEHSCRAELSSGSPAKQTSDLLIYWPHMLAAQTSRDHASTASWQMCQCSHIPLGRCGGGMLPTENWCEQAKHDVARERKE
jgi:hypothetical protein